MAVKHEQELSGIPELLRDIAAELNPDGRRLGEFQREPPRTMLRTPAEVERERQTIGRSDRLKAAAEIIEEYLGRLTAATEE